VAPNLTPDTETGIGRWTDDMLARAIREGVAHDGRVLHPQMWSSSFRRLTDEDVASVIVYLRSLKPVRNPLPATVLPKEVADDLDVPEPLTKPMPAPDPADPLARGRYLAYIADCGGCHTSWYTPRNPGLFAGGNLVERGDNRRAYSTNITSDASGIAYYDHALFREVMRTGRVRARELSAIMPWTSFRHLSDPDLDALFDYLRAYQPAKHSIDNSSPAAACEICGGSHPLGEYNKTRLVAFISYDAEDYRDGVGVYRFEDGFEIEILIARGKLVGRMDGNDCALETENGRVFQCPGEPERIEFTRDATGRVIGLTSNRVERAVKQGR
jgi:mono/diheme cytochrome c family protein